MADLSLSLSWRRIPERYRLIGSKCEACGKYYFPSREICPQCRRKSKISKYKFSGKGTLYAFTHVTAPPRGFELQAPYILGIVELEEGARVTAQIVDVKPEALRIGMPVEVTFRKIVESGKEGVIHYGFKFRPRAQEDRTAKEEKNTLVSSSSSHQKNQ